jgi:hypothetical protein
MSDMCTIGVHFVTRGAWEYHDACTYHVGPFLLPTVERGALPPTHSVGVAAAVVGVASQWVWHRIRAQLASLCSSVLST